MLAELGLTYVLDRTNDDQPYRLNVPGMLSLPYSVALNDLAFGTELTRAARPRRQPPWHLADDHR